MWVRFTQPYDFNPAAFGGRVTIAYRPGTVSVTRECGLAAIAAGKAAKATTPKKEAAHGHEDRRR